MLKIGEEVKKVLGIQDTNWNDATYLSGFTYQTASGKLQYRVKNGIFYTRGTVIKSSGNFTENTYVEVAQFPVEYLSRMASAGYDTAVMAPSAGGRYPARTYISTDGILKLRRDPNQEGTYFVINISFPLD